MNIYLAIACDKNLSDPKRMSNNLVSQFYAHGEDITIFAPANAFSVIGNDGNSKEHTSFLYEINMYALSKADVLLIHYQPGTESWGVPMEIQYFYETGKPIYIYTDEMIGYGKLPAYLAHFVEIPHCFFRGNGEGPKNMINQMLGEYRDNNILEE